MPEEPAVLWPLRRGWMQLVVATRLFAACKRANVWLERADE